MAHPAVARVRELKHTAAAAGYWCLVIMIATETSADDCKPVQLARPNSMLRDKLVHLRAGALIAAATEIAGPGE